MVRSGDGLPHLPYLASRGSRPGGMWVTDHHVQGHWASDNRIVGTWRPASGSHRSSWEVNADAH